MKKLLLIAVLILFPLHAQAFDFHGIKAGMSKDQVSQALKTLETPEPRGDVSSVNLDSGQHLKGVKWSPNLLIFEYDHENRLYSLKIHYPLSFGRPEDLPAYGVPGVAFVTALEKKYGAVVETERKAVGISYNAVLVDEKRLARYLDHLIKETMAAI